MQPLSRLLGLETEYAIRFTPAGRRRPTNAQIFDAIAASAGELSAARTGRGAREVFVENGGVLHYEAVPWADQDGLVEGGTPECRGPATALLYQRAQDTLLLDSLAGAQAALERDGFPGELGLLKNCRDAEGHIYGAQENYEVEVGRGVELLAWRAGLALLTPGVVAVTLVMWALVVVLCALLLVFVITFGLSALAVRPLRRTAIGRALFNDERAPRLARGVGLAVHWMERVPWEVAIAPFLLLCRTIAFRRVRRALAPFLATRPIVTGAGTLVDGRFHLSEKATAARRAVRVNLDAAGRCLFDVGNLCKNLTALSVLDVRRYASLYRRRQRLQLGLSDSNLAEPAEYLKLAITCLVIDAAEAGALGDVTPLARPIDALRAINADPTLTARVRDRAGRERTALEIQREYTERLRRFVQAQPATSLEALEAVRRYGEVLDRLERDRDSLFGWIDWVTKRRLLAIDGLGAAAAKKIDLKYHELGIGYFADLQARGLAPRLVDLDALQAARHRAPDGTPASARAAALRGLPHGAVRVAWDHVRVGGVLGNRIGGRVIRLDDHRRE